MNIYTIYKATNKINGKCYIGFDSNWPNRIKAHKTDCIRKNTHFYHAIRKYGWENFEWDIIYQSKEKIHTLKEMENYFIKYYNSYKEGYNSTFGGEGTLGFRFSEEHKKQKSENMMGEKNHFYGKKHKQESKIRNLDNRGDKNPRFGIKLSEETKEKQRNKMCKHLYEISCPDGTIISTNNLKKFCRDYNLNDGNLYKTIKGKISNHKGYVATIVDKNINSNNT